MPPRFLYFDLGNVLLNFDPQVAARQMAAVAGISPAQVSEAVFASGLEDDYERGAIDDQQFYEAFCQKTGVRPDATQLFHAGSDIFSINIPLMPLITALDGAGNRLGLLSNTNAAHWTFCYDRFDLLHHAFHVYALSFQIGAMKPDPRIYLAAAKLAGVAPTEIFFVDDLPGHVAGAREAGFDAVQYTSPAALAGELRRRGMTFNY